MKKGFLLLEFCCALVVFTTLLSIIIHYHGTIISIQQKIALNDRLSQELHDVMHLPSVRNQKEITVRYSWQEKSITMKHSVNRVFV